MKNSFFNPSTSNQFTFIAKATLFYCLWLILYYFIITEYTSIDSFQSRFLAKTSIFILNIFGENATLIQKGSFVFFKGDIGTVQIGNPCNGLKLFPLYVIFLLAFPSGSWKKKSLYALGGVIAIHLLNSIRVIALLKIHEYAPEYLDFNHDYTFTFIMYGFIFFLWYAFSKNTVKK